MFRSLLNLVQRYGKSTAWRNSYYSYGLRVSFLLVVLLHCLVALSCCIVWLYCLVALSCIVVLYHCLSSNFMTIITFFMTIFTKPIYFFNLLCAFSIYFHARAIYYPTNSYLEPIFFIVAHTLSDLSDMLSDSDKNDTRFSVS